MPGVKLDSEYWKFYLRNQLKGYKQREIADAIGVSQQAVSSKLKSMSFTLPEMVQIIRTFDIPMDAVRKVVEKI